LDNRAEQRHALAERIVAARCSVIAAERRDCPHCPQPRRRHFQFLFQQKRAAPQRLAFATRLFVSEEQGGIFFELLETDAQRGARDGVAAGDGDSFGERVEPADVSLVEADGDLSRESVVIRHR